MQKSQERIKEKIKIFPHNPGVYIFKNKAGKILYIGKATSLKNRVGSYFVGAHNAKTEKLVSQIEKIDIKETDSVLEALILESNLIKKYQPKYNIKEKDDKSFSYFVITREEFPRVLIVRGSDLKNNASWRSRPGGRSNQVVGSVSHGIASSVSRYSGWSRHDTVISNVFGPYTSKKQMQIAFRIIRKIFPFHSLKQNSEKRCLDSQIGLCPGPYSGKITKQDYKKNIMGIKMILEGKIKGLVKKMEKEMKKFSNLQEFEKAGDLKNKIFSLQHIQDIAFLSDIKKNSNDCSLKRVEAYDISNISGKFAVGSMVVFQKGKPHKSQYRKFKIKTIKKIDDVAMMREVLMRRFKNNWVLPELILLDGGKGHLNMAKNFFKDLEIKIPIIAIAKGPTRKKLELRMMNYGKKEKINDLLKNKQLIGQIMDEAHRFAINYHRKLRGKIFN